MTLPFREYHLLALLNEYDELNKPIDMVVALYFRAHKALGSKDRAYIADRVYTIIRWKGLLDYLTKGEKTWASLLETFRSLKKEHAINDKNIPAHIRVSFPKELYQLLIDSHGEKKAHELCLISNTAAPATVRANALKTSREALLFLWKKEGYQVLACQESPHGITFEKRISLFSLPEFKQGFFEMQDEGSQLVAFLVDAHPKDHVLDYCAGSGGKTLAFAPNMKNQGQIYLHDIRPWALTEAKKRLKRAGIQNAQLLLPDDQKKKRLKKKMDWVIVDAPCTGTGTLRRNPDMKWSFSKEMLDRIVKEQRVIFEKALSFLKPKGRIIYATCSLLKEENEEQMEHFLQTYDLSLVQPPLITYPKEGGMDGFFSCTFARKG